ncbi:MAG: ABC transporter permease [Pseudomonadales bacterium]|jgi:putative ABC transport system permease protein|nr:ABC transporter permease [Pseudomonadales bacterium]
MFMKLLKNAFVQIARYKLFSILNVIGLSLGLACTLLISIYILSQLSYDRQYQNNDRIFRVSREIKANGGESITPLATNAPLVAELLKSDFPEVKAAARLFSSRALLKKDESAYYEDSIQFVDNSIFEIFIFNWIAGDPLTALSEPSTIVLTSTLAKKYFGTDDPLGQTLIFENSAPFRVSGVIEDLPNNTHLKASAFVSLKTLEPVLRGAFLSNWDNNIFHTYVLLNNANDHAYVEGQLPAFVSRHIEEDSSTPSVMRMINVKDIHLYPSGSNELSEPANIPQLLTFGFIAFGVLAIACVNFINLTTSLSVVRLKEIGIRKTLGASKGQLRTQFLFESMLLTAIAMVIGWELMFLTLPYFENFFGISLDVGGLYGSNIHLNVVLLFIFVTLFSGLYPAFYLSSFNPIDVLRKGWTKDGLHPAKLQNFLIIFQFSASVVLITCTLIVISQIQFMQNFNVGFKSDNILILSGPPTVGLGNEWPAMKNELLGHSGISSISASNLLPFDSLINSFTSGTQSDSNRHSTSVMTVDYDFFETYAIEISAGRPFSRNFPGDELAIPLEASGVETANFIINEATAKLYGWTPQEAVGQPFQLVDSSNIPVSGAIVGVAKNSFFESVRVNIKPMTFVVSRNQKWGALPTLVHAALVVDPNSLPASLDHIRNTWRTFMPDSPVNVFPLSQKSDSVYTSEIRQNSLLNFFSIFAMLISILGLYGLASFNSYRRTKEIGIRKILGSSSLSVLLLLNGSFNKLLVIAILIAWPIAFYILTRWLDRFLHHVSLNPLFFALSALVVLIFAWATAAATSIKFAYAKPAVALRSD